MVEINTVSQKKETKFTIAEKFFSFALSGTGALSVLLLGGIFITLLIHSLPSIQKFGFSFLGNAEWNPVTEVFGALPFLAGTLIISFLALIISTPFSLGIAILLGEYFREGVFSSIIRSVIELLAGVPSVVFGLWGILFLVPIVQGIEMKMGIIPDGVGLLTAAVLLSIMVIPYSATIAREVISMVPSELKEAAYSLGSTRFEVVRKVIIPYSRSGIFAGIVLALGRALGETMAVTMVIGNRNSLPHELIIMEDGILGTMQSWSEGVFSFLGGLAPVIASFFGSSNSMASIIANEFAEATSELYLSSLIQIALLLFIVSTVINIIGKETIRRLGKNL